MKPHLLLDFCTKSENFIHRTSDAPTGRFGRTVGSVSDNQWVRSVLTKNYQTPNSSVILFFDILIQHFSAEKNNLERDNHFMNEFHE